MAQIEQIEVNGVIYDITGTGSGGHEINDSEGTSLTQRDVLQFGEGLLAEDDSVNEKTVVLPDAAPAEDMSEIVTPLPSVMSRLPRYSTEEQIVGYWIDGKPIYQRTWTSLSFGTTKDAWTNVGITLPNCEMILNAQTNQTSMGRTTDMFMYRINSSNVQYFITTNATAHDILTLQYTKTTDTSTT